MKEKPPTILEHFSDLTDPRVHLKTKHKLIDILVITVCGVICGADNWTEIAGYGKVHAYPDTRKKRAPLDHCATSG